MAVGASQRILPTATGFAVKSAIAALQSRNIAPGPLLQRVGLSESELGNPQRRLSVAAQAEFLERAGQALGDTAFGLHLAEGANPRQSGVLFYVGSAAKDFGEAQALFARYLRIVNESARVKLTREREGMVAEWSFVGVSRHLIRQNVEFGLAVVVRGGREITGRDLHPIRVAFAHERTNDLKEFERFFGCRVEFGQPHDQMAFSSETLALPLVTGDPHLLETLRPFCDEAARVRHTVTGSMRAAVENEIQRFLPDGRAQAETVARSLAVSPRTLARRLAKEGTTFADVVDHLRRSLAAQYLHESNFTLAQIGWLLGYEGPTSFHHAFKRWTGRSPSVARSQALLPRPAPLESNITTA